MEVIEFWAFLEKNIAAGVYKMNAVWVQRPDTIGKEYPIEGEHFRIENPEDLDIPPIEKVVPNQRRETVINGATVSGVVIH